MDSCQKIYVCRREDDPRHEHELNDPAAEQWLGELTDRYALLIVLQPQRRPLADGVGRFFECFMPPRRGGAESAGTETGTAPCWSGPSRGDG